MLFFNSIKAFYVGTYYLFYYWTKISFPPYFQTTSILSCDHTHNISVEVRSRFGRGSDCGGMTNNCTGEIQALNLSLFPMNYENYTISATVEMHGLGSIYHLLQMLFLEYIPTQIIFSPQLYSLKISGFCCEI